MIAKFSIPFTILAISLSWPSPARSQEPEVQLVKRVTTKNERFRLPILTTDEIRATLSEVQLYVKVGDKWTLHETVAGATPHFDYRSTRDGDHFFAVVTVDKTGKPSREVAKLTPDIWVVVEAHGALPAATDADVVAKRVPAGDVPKKFDIRKTFTKNAVFNLPIQMDERTRAQLTEVRLYVKAGAGEWVRAESVPPATPHFQYRVPADGEYWFGLTTVDRDGKASAEVADLAPALRVVVDTKPPVIEAEIATDETGPFLRVKVADDNLDSGSLRAEVVLADDNARALTPTDGVYRLTARDLEFTIRVSASDLSGNRATKDLEPKKRP